MRIEHEDELIEIEHGRLVRGPVHVAVQVNSDPTHRHTSIKGCLKYSYTNT